MVKLRLKKSLIALGIIGAIGLGLVGCSEGFNRRVKEFQSNYSGGLDRVLTIYSENGEVLAKYEGKFDIEHSGDKIKFMQDGKMRNIYLGNSATVIVEEK